MPGPAPDPNAIRRNLRPNGSSLPAEGRLGDPPPWPLLDDVVAQVTKRLADDKAEFVRDQINDCTDGRTARKLERELDNAIRTASVIEAQTAQAALIEDTLWRELWATPQAVAWERLRWTREVAQYVRWKVKAEQGDLDASKEARQLADRLGLTPMSMLRLRWSIDDGEAAPTDGRSAPGGRYSHLRAVEDQ